MRTFAEVFNMFCEKPRWWRLPHWQKAEARQCVHALFGGGNGPYYRVHHGENMLSPEKQEEILKVLAMFGSIEGIGFDHYVTVWDFG